MGGDRTALVGEVDGQALLVGGPAWATDPMDVDPDPDGAPTLLYVEESESVDAGSLPPGHYVVIVRIDDAPDETYELWVQ